MSGRFFLSLKSKACRLAPPDHSPCAVVHIGVAKSKMYFPEKPEILKGRGGFTIMEF